VAKGFFNPDVVTGHWRRTMAVLLDIAEGMAYIHGKRICHGDLNPANVLLKVRPRSHRRSAARMCLREARACRE
jgi:Protein tyrosine and serine/threonine kinase